MNEHERPACALSRPAGAVRGPMTFTLAAVAGG